MLQLFIFFDFPCNNSEIRLKPTQADFSVTNIPQPFEDTIDLQLRRPLPTQIVRCLFHKCSDLLAPQHTRPITLEALETLDDDFFHVFADFCNNRPDPKAQAQNLTESHTIPSHKA
jgi:hypothetical protein